MSDPTVDTAPWYKPKEAAGLIYDTASERNTERVRNLCRDRLIDHRNVGNVDHPRYLISGQAIRRYIRRNTIKAA